jgi:hypothetical protein
VFITGNLVSSIPALVIRTFALNCWPSCFISGAKVGMKSEAEHGDLTQRAQRHGGRRAGDEFPAGVDARKVWRSGLFELTDSGGSCDFGCYFFCARPTRKREPSAHVVHPGRLCYREKRILLVAFSRRTGRIVAFFCESQQSRSAAAENASSACASLASVTCILSW